MDNQDFPVVVLINSKPETLFSIRHFEHLINREMGHDAANFFHRVVEDYEEEVRDLMDIIKAQDIEIEDLREVAR